MLKGVKFVGFDLDGTLYKPSKEMSDIIRNKISEKILEKRSDLKNLENARKLFENKYKELNSGTKVLKDVGFENPKKVMDECLATANITNFISKDIKLINLMNEIKKKYKSLYLITHSPKDSAEKKLQKIGISPELFDHTFFSNEEFNKYDGGAFIEVMKKIGFGKSSEHVYIGDKLESDILPAKKLGMKTIAVWSSIPEADVSLNHIHDIKRVLLDE